MNRFKTVILAGAALATVTIPSTLSAHRMWMVPSTTIVSGDDDWVTFDGAISNDLFYPDHQPMRAEPQVTAPDGSAGKVENFSVGRYRATFDLRMSQKGTWRVSMVNTRGVMGSYTLNGKEERLPRGLTRDKLASAIPAGATNVKLGENHSRTDVFVTAGAPTDTVLKPTGQGLEFVPVTHPNDLVASEAATFAFTVDGKPAAGIELTVVPGGSRYREGVGEMKLRTDAKGQVQVKWPAPGMYWINTTATGTSDIAPGAQKRMGYTAVVEVLGG